MACLDDSSRPAPLLDKSARRALAERYQMVECGSSAGKSKKVSSAGSGTKMIGARGMTKAEASPNIRCSSSLDIERLCSHRWRPYRATASVTDRFPCTLLTQREREKRKADLAKIRYHNGEVSATFKARHCMAHVGNELCALQT
eukprot:SAG31_NODE_4162_length_3521_cov_31.856224_2_plen_144_part_00